MALTNGAEWRHNSEWRAEALELQTVKGKRFGSWDSGLFELINVPEVPFLVSFFLKGTAHAISGPPGIN